MRRQTQPHGLAARWVMSPLDCDPYALPARYALTVISDSGDARDACDLVEINNGSITVEHRILGVSSVVRTLPLGDFLGIAIRIESLNDGHDGFAISVNLHHPDPKLCFVLHMSYDMDDVCARWQSWGNALKLPLLLPSTDGSWREPIDRFGKLKVNTPYVRPARLALNSRRSAISSVREIGDPRLAHQIGGAEMIARN